MYIVFAVYNLNSKIYMIMFLFQTGPNSQEVRNLQAATVVVGSDSDECRERWRRAQWPKEITASQGGPGPVRLPRRLRGPLVYTVKTTPVRNVTVGVVSMGKQCDPRHPTSIPNVFSRVSSFMPWILDHIRQ